MALFALLLMNIWRILLKHAKYKTVPLLFFYIFAFLAISLRIVNQVTTFRDDPIFWLLSDVFIVTKLCVGLTQAWMIFEIALRIKYSI